MTEYTDKQLVKMKKGKKWDGKSRIPTEVYKNNWNDIFGKAKKDADEEESDYRGGKAYHAFLKLFYKNKKDKNDD